MHDQQVIYNGLLYSKLQTYKYYNSDYTNSSLLALKMWYTMWVWSIGYSSQVSCARIAVQAEVHAETNDQPIQCSTYYKYKSSELAYVLY